MYIYVYSTVTPQYSVHVYVLYIYLTLYKGRVRIVMNKWCSVIIVALETRFCAHYVSCEPLDIGSERVIVQLHIHVHVVATHFAMYLMDSKQFVATCIS